MTGFKVRCPRCHCFILGDGEPVVPETLPEPHNHCDLKPICTCHTGVGLIPRFQVYILGESAKEYARRYSNITCRHGDDPAVCLSCKMLARRPSKNNYPEAK